MTFEQRMAELGVDLSDLRTDYSDEEYGQVFDTYLKWGEELEGASYILHLVDIIDRMETRLVNLTGERDYLFERASGAGVLDCADCLYNGEDCNDRCYDGTGLEHGVWAGVPEDWSADD